MPHDSNDVTRREAIKQLAAVPVAALALTTEDAERLSLAARDALARLAERGEQFRPKFFTPAEWRTVRVLSQLTIPRDERSGGAIEAGVPEFMDFVMGEFTQNQKWMRDGLTWLDAESQKRHTKVYADLAPGQQTAILDDIAWPRRAKPEMQAGVDFFNRFRDMTASGFFSSRIGVRDLEYIGNRAAARWNGCPPAALRKLGVSYGSEE
jgi:gluconate 2-dehydrogenase gamma chain